MLDQNKAAYHVNNYTTNMSVHLHSNKHTFHKQFKVAFGVPCDLAL